MGLQDILVPGIAFPIHQWKMNSEFDRDRGETWMKSGASRGSSPTRSCSLCFVNRFLSQCLYLGLMLPGSTSCVPKQNEWREAFKAVWGNRHDLGHSIRSRYCKRSGDWLKGLGRTVTVGWDHSAGFGNGICGFSDCLCRLLRFACVIFSAGTVQSVLSAQRW